MPPDTLARLRLARTRGIGPVSYRQLLSRFGSADAALDALPDLVRRGGGRTGGVASVDDARAEMAAVEALGARHIFWGDADYPRLLTQLPNAPVVLIIRGNMALASRRAVAIVGARNASAAACRYARTLAHELGAQGCVVVSGLARGIDTAAHNGALDSGTVGVIANGIDLSFPPENAALQERMASDHLVITEHPPGTEPLARHFPHRNRIIAGMAMGTIVVEAAPRSGSLLTARLATEAGREVMAVPGSPLDPRARGCNQLIREGATLIQSVDDVLEALAPMDGLHHPMVHDGVTDDGTTAFARPGDDFVDLPDGRDGADDLSDDDRRCIADLLGPVAVTVDELALQSGLPTQAIQLVTLELELAGQIQHHAGGRLSRV